MDIGTNKRERNVSFVAALMWHDEAKDAAAEARAAYAVALALWDNAKDAAEAARLEARKAFDTSEAATNEARRTLRTVKDLHAAGIRCGDDE